MIVADSTVFISLAKIGRLQLLHEVYEIVFMPQVVKQEVVDMGREIQSPEVIHIERGISQGWIKIVSPTFEENELAQQIQGTTSLDSGECEALALAITRNLPLIVDDREAREVTKAFGLEFTGTLGILLYAYISGYSDYDQFLEDLRDIANVMWLSPAIIAEVLMLAQETRQ